MNWWSATKGEKTKYHLLTQKLGKSSRNEKWFAVDERVAKSDHCPQDNQKLKCKKSPNNKNTKHEDSKGWLAKELTISHYAVCQLSLIAPSIHIQNGSCITAPTHLLHREWSGLLKSPQFWPFWICWPWLKGHTKQIHRRICCKSVNLNLIPNPDNHKAMKTHWHSAVTSLSLSFSLANLSPLVLLPFMAMAVFYDLS